MRTESDATKKIFTRRDQVVFREIAGEFLLVPIRGDIADMQRIFALNRVAAQIWEQLDGNRTLDELREEVVARFDVGADEAEKDLRRFIEALLEAGLIAG
jgi:hypothetical protein